MTFKEFREVELPTGTFITELKTFTAFNGIFNNTFDSWNLGYLPPAFNDLALGVVSQLAFRLKIIEANLLKTNLITDENLWGSDNLTTSNSAHTGEAASISSVIGEDTNDPMQEDTNTSSSANEGVSTMKAVNKAAVLLNISLTDLKMSFRAELEEFKTLFILFIR